MRKLIEYEQEHSLVCDKPGCGFNIPYKADLEEVMHVMIDTPCPQCGENLLTREDYLLHQRLIKTVAFVNKWFSWITVFYPKNAKRHLTEVHCHKGIHTTSIKEEPVNEKN